MRETRSGLRPDETRLPYVITPKDVQNYLQKRLDVVTNELRKQGKECQDVKIQDLISIEASNEFIPLVIFLPETAVVKKQKEQIKGNSIFAQSSKQPGIKLRDEIYNVLKPYVYSSKDRESFGTHLMKNTLKMSREKIYRIQEWTRPTWLKSKRSKDKNIVLLIDPIRVFHDMLKYVDAPQAKPFRINIENWKKKESGYYKYFVVREEITPKKENKDLAIELEQKMRSVNRG